jgi:N,N'-diacetyllegionaminate synthase
MKKPYIIAEIGINFQGKTNLIKKLILSAKRAGADAVKFQIFKASTLGNMNSKEKFFFLSKKKKVTLYQFWKKLEISDSNIKLIENLTKKVGIDLIFSVFDIDSLNKLKKIKYKYIKIASSDLTDSILLKETLKVPKPVILSTGMSNKNEITEALTLLKNKKTILLHCVSLYPCDLKDINLKRMETLSKTFKKDVGFSDHSIGVEATIHAIKNGAKFIEKHFTLDKNFPGPDHVLSADENDLRTICNFAKNFKLMLGDGKINPRHKELKIKKIANKSIYLKKNTKKNKIVKMDDLEIRRPSGYYKPKDINKILGKYLKINLNSGINLKSTHLSKKINK